EPFFSFSLWEKVGVRARMVVLLLNTPYPVPLGALINQNPTGRGNLCLRYRVICQEVMTQLWLFMRGTTHSNRRTQERQNLLRLVGCSGGGNWVVHELWPNYCLHLWRVY